MMKKILIGLVLFVFCFGNETVAALSVADDSYELIMQRLRVEEWSQVTDIPTLDSNVRTLLGTLRDDGSWADIPYTDRSQTNWPPLTHLNRLKQLVLAYTLSSSSYVGNNDLHKKVSAALRFWQDAHPTSTNWYMQQISCPKTMGVILILLRAGITPLDQDLEKELLQRMRVDGNRPDQSGSQGTGANKIMIATHWVYRACLEKNPEDLAFGTQQVYYPIFMTTGEGLQQDYSYLQHGQQFYTGGYGANYVGDVARMAVLCEGTPYAIPDDKRELLTNFTREAYLRLLRGKYFLYNVHGRGISRPGSLNQTSFLSILENVKLLDPEHLQAYNDAEARIRGTQASGYGFTPAQHTHYWRADYSLYTSEDYTFDVRMASTRTSRNENGNGEGLKSYFLTEGATNIAVEGDEYVDIFPVWDWAMIPGITAPHKTKIPLLSQWEVRATSTFAGGVSDSICGIAAYRMSDQTNGINTRARKSWFMFADEIVCLGSGITSTSAEEVNTTLNQCLLKGEVSQSADWVYHNKVGYFFPDGGNWKLTQEAQTGNWKDINSSQSNQPVSREVFKLWIDHGVQPTNEKYAYILVPGKDLSFIKSYRPSDNVEILSHTESVHAVRNKRTGTLGVVFFNPVSFSHNGYTISVDCPCALLIDNPDSSEVNIHLADVAQANAFIRLSFVSEAIPKMQEVNCRMPDTPFKGSTVVIHFSASPSTPIADIQPSADSFVYVDNGYVRVKGTPSVPEVFSFAGVSLNPKSRLEKGVYLVKVDDSVSKIIVP